MPELQPSTAEQEKNPELSSQEAYVENLWWHVSTIPDLAQLPEYWRPSLEDSEFLGAYCQAYAAQKYLTDNKIVPLQRDDIIEPEFCKYIDHLTRHVTGDKPDRHWYTRVGQDPRYNYYAQVNRAIWASRQWERFYIEYMRERRMFHAQFMTAILRSEPIDEYLRGIGFRDGVSVVMPASSLDSSQKEPAAPSLYNKTGWLMASALSALALPPDLCNVDMKRRAVELWAAHADLSDVSNATEQTVFDLRKCTNVVRLPWSMRSNEELQANHHPQWQRNTHIQHYLKTLQADGGASLLYERPKDYMQVLLLHVFGTWGPPDMKVLKAAGELEDEVKDIIFAEDASLNTVYLEPHSSSFDTPQTLSDLLDDTMEPATQEEIMRGLKLQVQVLKNNLAEAQNKANRSDKDAATWRAHYTDLYNRVRQSGLVQPTPTEALMARHGIHPGIDNTSLTVVIRALRHDAVRRFHPDRNQEPNAEELLKTINIELDAILNSRGLKSSE